VDPRELTDPHELKEFWLNRAIERAQIVRADWNPVRGFAKNRRWAEAVWTYYGQLFREHPQLRWAGMANMIGPTFYASFGDLAMLPDSAYKALDWMSERAPRFLAKAQTADLGFYVTTFLRMQKKVFEDQATMHEAYIDGGVPEIEKLFRARIIDAATLRAWRWIDDDASALVDSGNRMLLFREQFDIIDRFYLQMFRRHRPTGQLFTYLLTLAGTPSVPNAQSFPEQYPRTFTAEPRLAAIKVRTPLARGNIAMFANRWKLIDDDTLPNYLAFVRQHEDEALELVQSDVSERARPYRVLRRTGAFAAAALTRWKLEVSGAQPSRDAIAVWSAGSLLAAESGLQVEIDLTEPPRRGSPSFPTNTDSQVWMNPNREPFAIKVELPGPRDYYARAAMAVMLSSLRAGDPDRMIVQLPSMDIQATEQLIDGYATAWGFPADEVGRWRTRADRRLSSDRHYSSHVFTPDDVGFVHLEFQVSHHVRESICVVTVLFSWERNLQNPVSQLT
jgi:hypothetical protein